MVRVQKKSQLLGSHPLISQRLRKSLVLSLLGIVINCYPVMAEFGFQQTLHGTVMDQAGAALPGATVLVMDEKGALIKTTMTDSQGRFLVSGLLMGSYRIIVQLSNFAPTQTAVHVTEREMSPIEIILGVRPITAEITVTPGRGEVEEVFRTPEQVNVVTLQESRNRSLVILPQVFSEEVGIQVQQSSAHQGGVKVRGLTGQQVVHLIDGIRFNNSTFRPGPNQYLSFIDPSGVDRMEVVRGPNSSQYGSDALGGAVNILSRRPHPVTDRGAVHGELAPSFRSTDLTGNGSALLTFGSKKQSFLISTEGRRVQDLRPGGGLDSHSAITRFLGLPSTITGSHRLQDTAFTQWGLNTKFVWNPRDDRHVVLAYMRNEQRGARRYDQLDGGNGNLINAFDPQILDFFYLRFEQQGLGFLDLLTGTFSYNSQRDDRTFQGGSGNPLAVITDEFNDVDVLGYQVQATTHIGSRQFIVFGGEVYDEFIASRRSEFDPSTRRRVSAVRPRFPNGSRYTTYGLFVQDRADILERLSGRFGARYSAFHFRTFADRNPVDAAGRSTVPDVSDALDDFTFNAGLVLKLAEWVNFDVNISRGFRAPNTTDFSSVGLTSNGFEVSPREGIPFGGFIGTRADARAESTRLPVRRLAPETLRNYEIGIKARTQRLYSSVAFFDAEISDFITKRTLILPTGAVGSSIGGQRIIRQLPSGAVITDLDPRPVLVRANTGRVRILGIEATTRVQLLPSVILNASFSSVWGTDREAGGPPDIESGLPPATGLLSLRWRPGGKRYWLEVYSSITGKQDRLSSVELADQRIGATRSREAIAAFFNNGAAARGLVQDGLLLATGETLEQVQNRVLGSDRGAAPLFTKTPGFATLNVRGGYRISEDSEITFILENLTDRNYRLHGSGIDSPGINLSIGYRLSF